jgi:hypothetical protein
MRPGTPLGRATALVTADEKVYRKMTLPVNLLIMPPLERVSLGRKRGVFLKTIVRNTISAFAVGAALGAPLGIASAKSSDHRDFEGSVVHVSAENIKVHGVEGGRAQTISFLISPKVTKLTHSDGKATAELKEIHVGDMVKVRFDQKFLGLRHADMIIDETDGIRQKS